MNFLAPLFLAGAAAVVLPFVFHLIRRSSREKIPFSSLMFLEPSPPRITKRSRLEHLLLLLLRCAIICLLALAFARPFISKPQAGGGAISNKNRVLVLLDQSLSMRREDLWERACGEAIAAARSTGPEDQVAVYTFHARLNPVLSFSESSQIPQGSRGAVIDSRLSSVSPAWFGTRLGNALIGAVEILQDEVNRDSKDLGGARSKIILISDLQSGSKLDGLQGFEWPKNTEVQVVPVSGSDNSNAGIQILQDSQRLFFADTNLPVRARVANSPGSKIEKFQIQWRNGGAAVGSPVEIYVPAGQTRIVNAPPATNNVDSIALIGDTFDFDNIAWTARPVVRPVEVVYCGGESGDDPNQSLYYLRRAFEQTNLAVRVVAFTNNVPRPDLAPALVVLGPGASDEGLDLARQALVEGRTVLIPAYSTNEPALNMLAGISTVTEAPVKNFALFGEIDFNHPLFAPFSDSRYSDFTKIHFWRHRRLDLSGLTNATVLAKFDNGDPALLEIPSGKGKIMVLATTWTPRDSQFALSSKFVPLMFSILAQSGDFHPPSRNYQVGETIHLAAAKGGEITMPDGGKKVTASENFSETTLPGLYRLADQVFAVNIDPSESKITPFNTGELQSLGVPLGGGAETSTAAAAKRRQHLLATDLESRQKLWRNFVLAALALVFLETWVAGRLSRQPEPA